MTIGRPDDIAWDGISEPLAVPTRWVFWIRPLRGLGGFGTCGGSSHREEPRKASLCFPTKGGPYIFHTYKLTVGYRVLKRLSCNGLVNPQLK